MSNPATTGRELDDLLQGAFGDVQLPDRPTGFPAGLPEPVFMNNGMIAAVNVGTSQQESQTHLIFKDTETDQFVLMTAPDAVKMFNAAFDPLHDEIFFGDVTPLREHRMQYGGAINSRRPEGHRGPVSGCSGAS